MAPQGSQAKQGACKSVTHAEEASLAPIFPPVGYDPLGNTYCGFGRQWAKVIWDVVVTLLCGVSGISEDPVLVGVNLAPPTRMLDHL